MSIIRKIKSLFSKGKKSDNLSIEEKIDSIIEKQIVDRNKMVDEIDKLYDILLRNNEQLSKQYPENNGLLLNQKSILHELKRMNLKDKI